VIEPQPIPESCDGGGQRRRQGRAARALQHPATGITLLWVSLLATTHISLVAQVAAGGVLGMHTLRRRWRRLAMVVLWSPLPICFFWGMLDYAAGRATLSHTLYFHEIPPGWSSVDPRFRCGWRTGGDAGSWIRDVAYDPAVMLLCKLAGPMRGAYTGPYPTYEQALSGLLESAPLAPADVLRGCVRLDGESFTIDPQTVDAVLRNFQGAGEDGAVATRPEDLDAARRERGIMTAALFLRSCLLLYVPVPSDPGFFGQAFAVYCIDTAVGRPFATYWCGPGSYVAGGVRWQGSDATPAAIAAPARACEPHDTR